MSLLLLFIGRGGVNSILDCDYFDNFDVWEQIDYSWSSLVVIISISPAIILASI